MQVADRRRLLKHVNDDGRCFEYGNVNLMLLWIVGTNRGNKRARLEVVDVYKWPARGRASHNDVAPLQCRSQIGDHVKRRSDLRSQLIRHGSRSRRVGVEQLNLGDGPDSGYAPQLNPTLEPASNYGDDRRHGTCQVPRGNGGGCAGPHGSDFNGVHHRQRGADAHVHQDDHALNGRQAVPHAIVGEVRVNLRRKIRTRLIHPRGLYMKRAFACVYGENRGSGRCAERVVSERLLNRDDAVAEVEQQCNVSAGQDQHAACNVDLEASFMRSSTWHSAPRRHICAAGHHMIQL